MIDYGLVIAGGKFKTDGTTCMCRDAIRRTKNQKMAKAKILLQGLTTNDDHDTAVNDFLQLPNIDNYLFSLAVVRKSGVERISKNLEKNAKKVKIFIGIRNGITSVQSIFSLLVRLQTNGTDVLSG